MKKTLCNSVPHDKAALRLRVWIERENNLYIGIGSTLLLQKLDKLGSLKRASEELGMSYRRAWGKLKKIEQRMGFPLVEKRKGEGQRFTLTTQGREIMDKFLYFYLDIEQYALERARDILNMDVVKCSEFYVDDME
ncbi:winged helix-turn-helix domain-containing protein [Pseudodesulfovibrio senegalensis]|uniref:LysR family transcriptional regulator n=1 Tax=Pseudodesulfovibrio senegalensis TaxID=1721087 RepID=A0A6N6N617_9BACT|nr:LysR family transcriptional regulator [Pseudodesulfovibrio senegalensis]KAB1443622.1 LysR family transcriptional regulator [Pseudodesulfovibrio senegalensis]